MRASHSHLPAPMSRTLESRDRSRSSIARSTRAEPAGLHRLSPRCARWEKRVRSMFRIIHHGGTETCLVAPHGFVRASVVKLVSIAPAEERVEEIEEVLGIGDHVAVEVGAGGEEVVDEIEEVLAID